MNEKLLLNEQIILSIFCLETKISYDFFLLRFSVSPRVKRKNNKKKKKKKEERKKDGTETRLLSAKAWATEERPRYNLNIAFVQSINSFKSVKKKKKKPTSKFRRIKKVQIGCSKSCIPRTQDGK